MKKDSKTKAPAPVNISSTKIYFLERGRAMLKNFYEEQKQIIMLSSEIKIKIAIEKLLEKVCSENPLDPEKTKHWMKASIKLVDPRSICRVKPMKYSPQDVEEFGKQIKELLEMKIIIPRKQKLLLTFTHTHTHTHTTKDFKCLEDSFYEAFRVNTNVLPGA